MIAVDERELMSVEQRMDATTRVTTTNYGGGRVFLSRLNE
jgi:hypothetical protein